MPRVRRERSAGARRSEAQAALIACHAEHRVGVAQWLDQRNVSQNELERMSVLLSGYFSQLRGGTWGLLSHVLRCLQQVLGATDLDDLFVMRRVND